MTWESAVIMGLCALNLILILALLVRPEAKRDGWPNLDKVLRDPKMKAAQTSLDKIKQGAYPAAPEPPKDNGSVILMTQERDARLLDGQDD